MTGEFTGRRMAVIMVAFFAVVVSVNVGLAVMAGRSWTGLVVANSYVASQHFDEVTAKLETSAAMDVHPELSYENGRIRLSLHAASGAGVPVRSAVIKIGRPSHEREDRRLAMACNGSSECSVDTDLGAGLWAGEVEAELEPLRSWVRPIRLWVKAG
jgi:nitrogen fixation protein FixH